MTTYETYLAAVERLRDAKPGCCWLDYRGNDTSLPLKATVYDAEHDDTPATVEWCRTLGGEMFGEALMWSMTIGDLCVIGIHGQDDQTICTVGTKTITNPTRGDVLTLRRVHERKV